MYSLDGKNSDSFLVGYYKSDFLHSASLYWSNAKICIDQGCAVLLLYDSLKSVFLRIQLNDCENCYARRIIMNKTTVMFLLVFFLHAGAMDVYPVNVQRVRFFNNTHNGSIHITLNNLDQLIIRKGKSRDVTLRSMDDEFIAHAKISFKISGTTEDKEYTSKNSVIAQWNWEMAQALSCGASKEVDVRVDDNTLNFLDIADKIAALGEEESVKEGMLSLPTESDGRYALLFKGYRFPFHHVNKAVKIMNIKNESSQPLEIGINDRKVVVQEHGLIAFPIKKINDFKIQNFFINGNDCGGEHPLFKQLAAIVKQIFPGHYCGFIITDDMLRMCSVPLKIHKISLLNKTKNELDILISDGSDRYVSCVLSPAVSAEQGKQMIESMYQGQGSLLESTHKTQSPPQSPRGRSSSVRSQRCVVELQKYNHRYIKKLFINGTRYTAENSALAALNKDIIAHEKSDAQKQIEINDELLLDLANNEPYYKPESSSQTGVSSSSASIASSSTQEAYDADDDSDSDSEESKTRSSSSDEK